MSRSDATLYAVSRLEGLSSGVFRLEAQNATSNLPAQSVIRVTLPNNALLDVHSLAWHFDASTTSGAAGTVGCRLPNKIETMINRVSVQIGGVEVAAGCNFYNILCHVKDVVDGNWADDYGMNHPTIISGSVLDLNYVGGIVLTTEEVTGFVGREAYYCVNNWYGFIGECQPRVLDSSSVGDIVVTLFLEQPNLCLTMSDNVGTAAGFVTSALLGGALPNYVINNVYFTIRSYNLSDGTYEAMTDSAMASSPGGLEMGFKQYSSFRDLNTGATRFSLATQSLDACYTAIHENVTPSGATQHPVNEFGGLEILDGAAIPRTVPGQATLQYLHPYTQFSAPTAAAGQAVEFQYSLNSATYPMYRMTRNDVYQVLRLAGKEDAPGCKKWGYQQFIQDHFVCGIKLTMDAYNARDIQGLNTRGISLNGFFNIFNANVDSHVTLFVEQTSSLFIDGGRQISVIN